MSYRWLKFWGDLREGMHASWAESIDALHPHPELAHHHRYSATRMRAALGVARQWDSGFMPDESRWMMLAPREFDLWCEAVGLFSLGDHLKRVLSVRAVERLRIRLDRRMLAAIMQSINRLRPDTTGALPLHIPTARELGITAMASACAAQAPAIWSRIRLRLDKDFLEGIEASPFHLVHLPTMAELSALDAALFDASGTRQHAAAPEESPQKWTQSQTLSA